MNPNLSLAMAVAVAAVVLFVLLILWRRRTLPQPECRDEIRWWKEL